MENSSGITLYSVYKNAGFSWPLVASAISLNIPAILGLILNSALIWVTHRTKCLKGTANYLLALCSFFELLHQNGHLLFLYITLSGQNFLPYGLGVRICSVSLFGLGGIPISMAFTGLDRLLAIIFPTFHKSLNTKLYLGKLVPTNTNYAITRRVFRSLFIIILLNVGGYYTLVCYGIFIVPKFFSSVVSIWFSRQILGVLLNFGAAANAPILYFTSQEYRKAFQQEFPCLAKCCRLKPIITPHVPNGIISPSLAQQMQAINVHVSANKKTLM